MLARAVANISLPVYPSLLSSPPSPRLSAFDSPITPYYVPTHGPSSGSFTVECPTGGDGEALARRRCSINFNLRKLPLRWAILVLNERKKLIGTEEGNEAVSARSIFGQVSSMRLSRREIWRDLPVSCFSTAVLTQISNERMSA